MIFNGHIAVDWSANNQPKRGRDSIWIAEDGRQPENISTRFAAMQLLSERMSDAVRRGDRLHVGFDFAFGLPRGATQALIGEPRWQTFWTWLADNIADAPDNRSNRFEAAGRLNAATAADGPFWGHPWQHGYSNLRPKRCATGKAPWPHPFPVRRHADAAQSGASEVWQLAYTGSVGSQMLLGVAALERLRRGPLGAHIAIWPFETGFAGDLSAPVVLSEIYPSRHAVNRDDHAMLDAAQVVAVSRDFARADAEGRLANVLGAPGLTGQARFDALHEEGWIVGLPGPAASST